MQGSGEGAETEIRSSCALSAGENTGEPKHSAWKTQLEAPLSNEFPTEDQPNTKDGFGVAPTLVPVIARTIKMMKCVCSRCRRNSVLITTLWTAWMGFRENKVPLFRNRTHKSEGEEALFIFFFMPVVSHSFRGFSSKWFNKRAGFMQRGLGGKKSGSRILLISVWNHGTWAHSKLIHFKYSHKARDRLFVGRQSSAHA